MISYFKRVSSMAEDLAWDQLQKLLDSPEVEKTVLAIRQESDHDKRGELKRRLPAVTWQSHFIPGARRSDKNARPTGFFMLDIDHVSRPAQLWEVSRKALDLKDVLIAHITPSGEGLRIVMRGFPGLQTIADNQKHLAGLLQLNDYDAACKDFARLSYLCRRADVLYLNKDLFDTNFEKTIRNEKLIENPSADGDNGNPQLFGDNGSSQVAPAAGHRGANAAVLPTGKDVQLMYNEKIAYKTIVDELVSSLGGEPKEGTRNTFLYRLARMLRYIVDFDSLKLTKILPSFGLPQSEVDSVIMSACKSTRSEKIPFALYNVLKRLENPVEVVEGKEDEEDGEDSIVKLPPLPPVFKQFTRVAPEDFKIPTIMALLPIMGTLMSRLRATYLDGEDHAPNLTVVIEAPQASGKSFARKIVQTCMKEIEYIDSVSRIAEQQYMVQLRKSKNAKTQPVEPAAIVRIIPASVSIAKLLKRLCNAKGLHLFTFLEELDTMTKSNRAGAWSQKSDIYRNAFDNASYGQEYMSENSFSGIFPVYYNMLVCGTPNAVDRFYKDPEDGLVSRVIFCQIPNQFGAKMPVFKKLSSFELKMIDNICNQCNSDLCCTPEQEVVPEHFIDLSYLNKSLDKWIEQQRLLSVKEVSTARNIFYRRAAVMGFRAGMIADYLYSLKKEKDRQQDIIDFAIFIAEYVLNSLLGKFAKKLEKSVTSSRKEIQVNLFEKLPDNFERNDVIAMISKYDISTPVKNIIYGWKVNGYISETNKYQYKKLTQ